MKKIKYSFVFFLVFLISRDLFSSGSSNALTGVVFFHDFAESRLAKSVWLSCAEKLLMAGVDANSIGDFDRYVMQTKDLLALFVKYGFDINDINADGYPRFFYANVECLSYLRNRGVDITKTDCRGNSALLSHIEGSARNPEFVDIIEELIRMGADVHRKHSGRTALEQAQELRNDHYDYFARTGECKIIVDDYDKVIEMLQHPEKVRRLGGVRLPVTKPLEKAESSEEVEPSRMANILICMRIRPY